MSRGHPLSFAFRDRGLCRLFHLCFHFTSLLSRDSTGLPPLQLAHAANLDDLLVVAAAPRPGFAGAPVLIAATATATATGTATAAANPTAATAATERSTAGRSSRGTGIATDGGGDDGWIAARGRRTATIAG